MWRRVAGAARSLQLHTGTKMFPAALVVALLAGVAWSCPEGFQQTNFDQCSSEIESFSWEEGRSKCAHSGGPSAVLAPTDFGSGIVPTEIRLPTWALPKELGMGTRSVDECHVRPGCVTMRQICHGIVLEKMSDRGVCREVIGDTTVSWRCDDDVDIEMGCRQSDWIKTDDWPFPEVTVDCFTYHKHAPSMNLTLRKDYATVSISNRHLLDDCWCILAKLDRIFENNTFDAVVLSDLPRGSSFNITFPDTSYEFKKGAMWCQCFDKWTGLMLKTDIFSTGFSSQSCGEHDPCEPSLCGPNSVCLEIGDSASCSCKPNYIGSPPNCRPECAINSECPSNRSCIMEKCRDPCPGSCPFGSLCKVINHIPQCTCPEGYVGDAFVRCRPNRYAQLDECYPFPCGANTNCTDGLCGCWEGYIGDPYKGCKPECVINSECSEFTACIKNQCVDPCPGLCGKNAVCTVVNHIAICSCPNEIPGDPFESCHTRPLSRRWCVLVDPEDLKKAVAKLDMAVEDVAASTSNVSDALRTLEQAFKSVHLMKGTNISFQGDAISALILPKAIGVKDDGSVLSSVILGHTAEELARATNVSAAVVLPEPRPVAFLVYRNREAFNDGVHRVVSPVVEVFANVSYIDLVLRSTPTEPERQCAFWDVQTRSWNSSGCQLRVEGEVNDVCRCHHLTTFAQIVTDTAILTAIDEAVLEHVSVLGCTASLLGALGTLLAACLCREWRSRKSTQVLLHLTAAVALRDALFVAAAREDRAPRAACVAVGVLLHYAEMAAGAWCVVAGALQVFRFATLSSRGITHLVLRCVLTAWPAAVLPVAALLGARGPRAYVHGGPTAPGLCFPRDAPLLWSVTLPLGVASLVNAGVFAFLVWTLCGFSAEKRLLKAAKHGGPGLRAKALKCVVLFFLLGLPWLFGVPPGSRFLAYAFCFTATPQGLFLFVFFVLSNKSLRSSCNLAFKRTFAGYLQSQKTTSDCSESSNAIVLSSSS